MCNVTHTIVIVLYEILVTEKQIELPREIMTVKEIVHRKQLLFEQLFMDQVRVVKRMYSNRYHSL